MGMIVLGLVALAAFGAIALYNNLIRGAIWSRKAGAVLMSSSSAGTT
jgi:cell division protein FtsX